MHVTKQLGIAPHRLGTTAGPRQVTEMAGPSQASPGGPEQPFGEFLEGGATRSRDAAAAPHRVAGPSRSHGDSLDPGPLGRALKDVFSTEKRLDKLYSRVRRHGIGDVEEVIDLQVTVYKYSQQVELLSKLFDKATSALKEVLRSRM